jgi:hypothetical protein
MARPRVQRALVLVESLQRSTSDKVAVTVAYSPQPGQQQFYYPPARSTNGLALAALICGIAQFAVGVTFIPAIICGHLARRQIRRTGEAGDGMALAGLILGYVGGALVILGILLMFLLFSRVSSGQIPTGNSVPIPAN